MRKFIITLIVLMMTLVNLSVVMAAEPNDGKTRTAYTGGYRFFKDLSSDTIIDTGKPAMVFYAVQGLTTYTVDLYEPGYVNYVMVCATGGKGMEITWNRYLENSGPSQQDIYNKYKRPWDKDAQEKGAFADTKQVIYRNNNYAGRKAFDETKELNFSSNSTVPAVIGVWQDGHFRMYVGDDGPLLIDIPCSGIYNRINTMAMDKIGVYDVPWKGYLVTHSNTLEAK